MVDSPPELDSPPSLPDADADGGPPPASGEAAPEPAPVPGPRPAPSYSVVNAIMEKKEDGPGCRCGHTLTAVAAFGEEGSPGCIGPRLILFGGATALEGNSTAGPPSPVGGAGISEFGNPSFCFVDFWEEE